MIKTKIFSFVILIFCYTNLFSQEFGLPIISNYNPIDYNGQGQIWSITQTKDGVMLFGGNEGIYEYDGTRWNTIKILDNSPVRSMDISDDGIVYIGSVGSFGFLDHDEIGNQIYIPLSDMLDTTYSDFNDIWNTYVVDNYVIFNASDLVFKYNISSEKIDIIKPQNYFFIMHEVYNQLYVVDIGIGLKKFETDSFKLVFGGEKFARYISWFMLPYNENKILLGNSNFGLSVYNPNTNNLDEINTKLYFDDKIIAATDEFILENQLYSGKKLDDGNFALGTINKGIIIVDSSGKILQNINKSNGLNSETVHCFYQDAEGGLWSGLTYGISRLELNSKLRFWNEKTNLPGSIYNVVRFNDKLYASSNLGLFYLENNVFKPIPELADVNAVQVFELKVFDFPQDNQKKFLASATHGIWEINNTNANLISNLVSFNLYQSRKDSSLIYVLQEYDIYSLTFKSGTWIESNSLYNLKSYPSDICEDIEFNLWSIVDNKPVFIDAKNDLHEIDYFEADTLISEIDFYSVKFIDDKIIFLTSDGFYSYKNNAFFKIDFQKSINDYSISLLAVVSDKLFAYIFEKDSKNQLFLLNKDSLNEISDSTSFKRISEYNLIYPDGDSSLWIVTPQKLYRYNMKNDVTFSKNIKPLIRKIFINSDSLIYSGNLNISDLKFNFDYKFNNIKVQYSLPSFDNEKENMYSVSLVKSGEKESWSNWSYSSEKEYTNLKEGKYIFKIKAKNIYDFQNISNEIFFTISPPWYRTILAYLLYLIIFGLIVFFSAKLYSLKLIKEKQNLERIVNERTLEIREKNVELEQQKEEIQTIADNLIETNSKLAEKNEEINQQKEEIQAIADNLQELNETLFQKNEEINQQKEEIQAIADSLKTANYEIGLQNDKIISSIKYAQRIQNALLPLKENMTKFLPEFFVIFKPRDIVSGDFYWFRSLNFNGYNLCLIAVADCTGHGVPGALMSMLGISFLNEIVKQEDITTPAQVLNRLRENVKTSLKQTGKEGETKDGMDIAFCVINNNTSNLSFAGANLPVYIAHNEINDLENRLQTIKGDKMPIGIYINEKESFTNNDIQLHKGDCIYLSTDGYIDQPGGITERKFLSKKFEQLLAEISIETIENQKNIIENTFNNWISQNPAKTYKQIDDITVIGIKF